MKSGERGAFKKNGVISKGKSSRNVQKNENGKKTLAFDIEETIKDFLETES